MLSSGPNAGFAEINLPQLQTGSSIMPGKVNPVIPEAVAQAAMQVMGNDQVIAQACSAGNLELNQFLPLIAHNLLQSLTILSNASEIFQNKCVRGITANETICKNNVENSTATVTALLPLIGYTKASQIVKLAQEKSLSIKESAMELGYISDEDFENAITPEAVCRLGN